MRDWRTPEELEADRREESVLIREAWMIGIGMVLTAAALWGLLV